MPKIFQNVALLIESTQGAWDVSWKAGNMLLNRLCIDEDDAFESAGIYFLKYFAFMGDTKAEGKDFFV